MVRKRLQPAVVGQPRGSSGDSGSLFFFDLLLGGSMQPCSLLAVSASSGVRGVFHQYFSFPWQLRVCRSRAPRPL